MGAAAVVKGDKDNGKHKVGEVVVEYPPTSGTTSQSSVKINGIYAHVHGDVWGKHTDPVTKTEHFPVIAGGSSTVFIENKAAVRSGDKLDCGAVLIGSANNVLIG